MLKGSEVADFIWHNDAIILTNILKNLDNDLKQNGQYGMLFNLKQTLWHVFLVKTVKFGLKNVVE